METPTAAAMLDERLTRSTQALAIEVVAMRALIDALLENIDDLSAHIIRLSENSDDPFITVRGAGGLASIRLIHEWLITAMANLNDITATAAAETWD